MVDRIPAFVFLVGSALTAQLPNECSLAVRVLTPRGMPVEGVVRVEEKGGRVVEQQSESDTVLFCDLGIFPVTVTVGRNDSCNQVVVRNVPLTRGRPYTLTVTYDREACLHHPPTPPIPMCEILFRIADSEGDWISSALIEITNRSPAVVLTTDRYGRAYFDCRERTYLQGVIRATGYSTASFRIACSIDKRRYEHRVTLGRQHVDTQMERR
jgi:hypothetical protein